MCEGGKVRNQQSVHVRRCGRPGGVVVWVDVAIRDFVDGDRGGGGLGAKLADF